MWVNDRGTIVIGDAPPFRLEFAFCFIINEKKGERKRKKRRDKGRVNLCQLQQLSNENTKQDLYLSSTTLSGISTSYIIFIFFIYNNQDSHNSAPAFFSQASTHPSFLFLFVSWPVVCFIFLCFFFFNFICTKLTLKLSSL